MYVVWVRATGDTGIAFHWDLPAGGRAVSTHGSKDAAAQSLADYLELRRKEADADASQARLPL